jgi:hypothetical protein
MKEEEKSKFDLIWIIPEIIGELFIKAYIPIMLIRELSTVGILSINGMVYIAVASLLLKDMRLNGLYEIFQIKWRKN